MASSGISLTWLPRLKGIFSSSGWPRTVSALPRTVSVLPRVIPELISFILSQEYSSPQSTCLQCLLPLMLISLTFSLSQLRCLALSMIVRPRIGWLLMTRSSGRQWLKKRKPSEKPNSFCFRVSLRLNSDSCRYCSYWIRWYRSKMVVSSKLAMSSLGNSSGLKRAERVDRLAVDEHGRWLGGTSSFIATALSIYKWTIHQNHLLKEQTETLTAGG